VRKQKTLSVKIPAGVDQDDRIRLSGEGEAGMNGGPPGDLYVVVTLKPHPVFQRDGADLHCEMPVSFATAALGGEIEIPTLDGHAKLRIPAETQTGQVFRLRNKGIRPVRGSVTGDLYCHVSLETPVNLTNRQKELLREFEAINEEDPDKHSPRAKSFFDKVRAFFGP
jgi:molecular chaperone DnaJ